MGFGFQDIMDWSGGGESSDEYGNGGILSALENIGVNFAAGAAPPCSRAGQGPSLPLARRSA